MNLDDIKFNDRDSATINYVKARMAIEGNFPNRKAKRTAKLVVIEHLGGVLQHPTPEEVKKGAQKIVVFPDNTKARF